MNQSRSSQYKTNQKLCELKSRKFDDIIKKSLVGTRIEELI